MEIAEFIEKCTDLCGADNSRSNTSFILPAGTEYCMTYSVEDIDKIDKARRDQILYVTESDVKIPSGALTKAGIRHYQRNARSRRKADPALTRYGGYFSMTWEHLWKQEKAKEAALAGLNKITPDFSVKKEKGVITFENNKTGEKLHCDLGKQTFSRSYIKGKDRVIRYPAQFFKYVSGRLLINKIEEESCETFTELMSLVSRNYRQCRNFGTFLVKMFDHQHLEQYIAAGVQFDFNTPFSYSDFSKDIRAKLNECNIKYTQDIGSLFCSDLDTGRAVFAQIKDKAGFKNIVKVLTHNIQPLNTLVNHYNYDLKTLFAYCRARNWQSGRRNYYYGTNTQIKPNPEDIAEEVAINSYMSGNYDCVSYLRDYARMALDVHGDAYEKYPANLTEAHDAVTTLHSLRAQKVNAEKFEETIDKDLEWKNKDFVVVYPKTPDEIIEEGKKLRHCVGSYIQSVVRGECKIVFLRSKENPDTPLVTIEISGGNIRQARGYGNSNPTYDAKMALKDYAKEKKLTYVR